MTDLGPMPGRHGPDDTTSARRGPFRLRAGLLCTIGVITLMAAAIGS